MPTIKRFHPGIYIKDSLEAMEMTSKEFSLRTGISERILSSIINGKCSITFEVAYKLSKFFDSSIDVWTNLQTQYDMYLHETEIEKELDDDWNLVKNIKKYLIDHNYIDENDKKEIIVEKVRRLVGVNNLTLLNNKDSFVCFKEQQNNGDNYFYQNFWVALAIKEARKKKNNSFNSKLLKSYISEMRNLTTKSQEEFIPRLIEIFEECGVSFVLLPYLTKSYIYGVTKWLGKDNVMLAVSNKSEKADLFWFTIFHELSHVLMEHRRETLISVEGRIDEEANEMAKNILIPKEEWNDFVSKRNFSEISIKKFAGKINILPCIVLGRLHKELPDIVPYGMYDKEFNVSYNIN